MKTKILPTVTTTHGADWRKTIRDAMKFDLKEIAFFSTGLGKEEREEACFLLKEAKLRTPFVHLRSDMEPAEIDFLINELKAEIFNIHSEKDFSFVYNYSNYKRMIYLENSSSSPWIDEELINYAGVCVDFSHLENERLRGSDLYEHSLLTLKKYPRGCAHLGPVKNVSYVNMENGKEYEHYDSHRVEKLSEFDYLKKYVDLIPKIAAVEVENSLTEQLEAIEYIKKQLDFI
ncbi:MAG: hypothetical protein PHY40_02080 [Patescibacteria group bacterium]|nr:hypothetical protein [Patescibacteria group bacterium]